MSKHEARRAALIAALDKLLAMTMASRDTELLMAYGAIDGPFAPAWWREFEQDVEVQEKAQRAKGHYEMLTSDWPVVSC